MVQINFWLMPTMIIYWEILLVSAMQMHGVLCEVVNLYCICISFIGETARISLCNMVIVLYFKVSYRKAWENCVQTL